MKELIVSKNEDGIRIDKYLKKIFTNITTNLLYKLIRKKYFKINDEKSNGSELLKAGDKIQVYLSDETFEKFIALDRDTIEGSSFAESVSKKDETSRSKKSTPKFDKNDIKNRIIYEDENVILFDKPVGLLSQSNEKNGVSVNSVLNDYIGKNTDSIYRPSVVNRLDRNTSGIIIFAKTYIFSRAISSMIKNEEVDKYYIALVDGVVKKNELRLIHFLKKDKSINRVIVKEYDKNEKKLDNYVRAELVYKVIKRYEDKTLLSIKLITGKTHQIRAQLAYIGYPIYGERKYKIKVRTFDERMTKSGNKDGYQKLMCYKIKFKNFENDSLKYLDNKSFEIDIDNIKKSWGID